MAALLCCSAFFSGSETALFSLDQPQKRRLEASRAGRRALALLSQPDTLLTAILLGNTLVNVAAASVASLILMEVMGREAAFGTSVLGMTFLLLVAGEITPKLFAVRHSGRVAQAVSWPLAVFVRSVSWLSRPLASFGRAAVRLAGGGSKRRALKESEIISLLELGHSEGVLGSEALVTVSLLSLGERQCRHAMVPRSEVVTVSDGWPAERVLQTVRGSRFSRYPVLDENGAPRGSARAADLLSDPSGATVFEMPCFPENAPLDRVLEVMRSSGGMGAVFDEYGDWTGVITVGDILDFAVFHAMSGRRDLPEGVHRRGVGFVIPGTLRVEVLERLLDADIDPEYAETCGGFLEEVTGRIPAPGEVVEHSGLRMTVLANDGPRVESIMVERTVEP